MCKRERTSVSTEAERLRYVLDSNVYANELTLITWTFHLLMVVFSRNEELRLLTWLTGSILVYHLSIFMNLSRQYSVFVKNYQELPGIDEKDAILQMMCREKSFVSRMDFFYMCMAICSAWLGFIESFMWEINVFFSSVHLIAMCYCAFVGNRNNQEEHSIEKDETNV